MPIFEKAILTNSELPRPVCIYTFIIFKRSFGLKSSIFLIICGSIFQKRSALPGFDWNVYISLKISESLNLASSSLETRIEHILFWFLMLFADDKGKILWKLFICNNYTKWKSEICDKISWSLTIYINFEVVFRGNKSNHFAFSFFKFGVCRLTIILDKLFRQLIFSSYESAHSLLLKCKSKFWINRLKS